MLTKFSSSLLVISVLFIYLKSLPHSEAIESFSYRRSLEFKTADHCASPPNSSRQLDICDPFLIHIAMTLDLDYLRGSVAAVHSLLKHSLCPRNIFVHFLVSDTTSLEQLIRSIFPSLMFKTYYFNPNIVQNKISSSVRPALEQPLNYARNYLAGLISPCVERIIYLDSDIILVDDIMKLWTANLATRTVAAPEYCNANFTRYFTTNFWSEKKFSGTFEVRKPCYFNTGVMMVDLVKWRKFGITKKIEQWMEVQRNNRIYELGSLPPFLLVFAGKVAPIEHRWNQHGLGGDNVKGSCRDLHPGPISLLHWSGSGKPWLRMDSNRPCPIDALWALYDLYEPSN